MGDVGGVRGERLAATDEVVQSEEVRFRQQAKLRFEESEAALRWGDSAAFPMVLAGFFLMLAESESPR